MIPRSAASSNTTPSQFRWVICGMLFLATTINYMDRQILSILKPVLDQELHWTNEEFGWINAIFQGAYAASYLFFGWFVDRHGIRLGYAVSITAWSFAAAAHALVSTIPGFGFMRLLLGLGEGGNFPAAIKTVATWFPREERALATTLFNSGSNVGALLAPAIIPVLADTWGWQSTFVVAGVAGLIWLAFWLAIYREPHPGLEGADVVAPTQADAIAHAGASPGAGIVEPPIPWRGILKLRQTWGYLAARFLTDPVWWFFLIWLPDYFKKTQGMDLKKMGLPLISIYAIVTVLSIAGGWAGKRLADRGWSVTKTRKVTLLLFAVGVLPVVLATQMPLWLSVILIGLAGGCHQAWSATLYTTVSDVFPPRAIGSLVGLGGLVGSLGGMIFPVACGYALDHFGSAGYGLLFGYCGLAYVTAFALHHLLIPTLDPLRAEDIQ